MEAGFEHLPVLFREALEALNLRPEGRYIDGTYGRGGHSGAILAGLSQQGRLLAVDRDAEAVVHAQAAFGSDPRFTMVRGSFAQVGEIAAAQGWMGQVDGLLLDLGVSSPQLDDPQRGFSFLRDGPLDMRMDGEAGLTAAQWLAEATEAEIADVLARYGEERFARRIARALVKARVEAPILTTKRLSDLVSAANPAWEKGKHPATRSFQAIRIFLNGELEALEQALDQSLEILRPGGRLAVISFHSLEDRIVKRFIRDQARGDYFPPGVPVSQEQLHPKLIQIGRAIHPGEEEVATNPRARSAVLRVAERAAA